MARSDQTAIPAAFIRGGSSKALFFHEHDIPPSGPLRDRVLKKAMGTPDPIQIDGMGGTKAVTSKIAIIKPSDRENIDVDYTFVQVGVRDDTIGYAANCGNISAGVGPFAIDEGIVKTFRKGKSFDSKLRAQEVRIYHTGTKKNLIAHVPIDDSGKSIAAGGFKIAAVPGTGAPILLDYCETIGASRGRGLLPSGNVIDRLEVSGKTVQVTICDAANICVFAAAQDFDISGHETAAKLTDNARLIAQLKELRGKAAQLVGMCQDWKKVDEQSAFMPMPVLIAPAPAPSQDNPQSHLAARLFLDNMCHESMAGTGSVCTAACSQILGSVVFNHIGTITGKENVLRISHPLGMIPVAIKIEARTRGTISPVFETLSFVRTSRRLMDGKVYVPKDVFDPSIATRSGHPDGVSKEDSLSNGTVVNDVDGHVASESAKGGDAVAKNAPVTEVLAQFIANARAEVLSPVLREKLKEVIIDYIGVVAAAARTAESTEPIYNAIVALGGANGSSTVLTKGKNFSPQYAALLNATLGHSMDFDDTYAEGTLHAGVTVISTALTQAELLGPSSRTSTFLTAVAVGYEITCRLGRELGYEAYSQGMHNTSTAGIFGAVATIAVLKNLPQATIEMAFGLAGSKAAGSMQYLDNGSWNKRLHPGFAAHDAFMCVALAEAGVIGATKAIEGKLGFLHAYSPKRDKDLRRLTQNLGSEWIFLASSLKPYPACRMTHGFIEMAELIGYQGERRKGDGSEVERITLSMTPANLSIVGQRTPNKLRPVNTVDAQFSAYYQTAHAWIYGSNTGSEAYTRLENPEIRKLSERITCVDDASYRGMESRIKVRWTDGTEEEQAMPAPLGEASHPFTRDKVEQKFFSLASPVYGAARATLIRDMVDNIEGHSVIELLALLGGEDA